MIVLWVALFLLVVGISFVLAYQSMKDYSEIPAQSEEEYGLFLIRQIDKFDIKFLDSIHELILKHGLIVSIERLFKGSQAALTIFGPKKILAQFSETLNLLELEDYTLSIDDKDIVIWEIGAKNLKEINLEEVDNVFSNLPKLDTEDQFFWQIVVGGGRSEEFPFHTQIRAAIYSKDLLRRKALISLFQNLKFDGLVKFPRPYSTEQMMSFYQSRALSQDSKGPILDSLKLMRLLKIF